MNSSQKLVQFGAQQGSRAEADFVPRWWGSSCMLAASCSQQVQPAAQSVHQGQGADGSSCCRRCGDVTPNPSPSPVPDNLTSTIVEGEMRWLRKGSYILK